MLPTSSLIPFDISLSYPFVLFSSADKFYMLLDNAFALSKEARTRSAFILWLATSTA